MISVAVERTPGEIRAAAFTENGTAISLFQGRDKLIDPRPDFDDVLHAVIRKVDKSTGSLFLDTDDGIEVFANLKAGERAPAIGEHVNVRVRSEAHSDKLARVAVTTDEPIRSTPEARLEAWMSSLAERCGKPEKITDTEAAFLIDEAFEIAESSSVTLKGGGQLHIDHARALTAVDVDSSGRKTAGSRRDINLDAVTTLAAQVSLRRLGGIVVMDLLGASDMAESKSLQQAFRKTLSMFDGRRANILPVNRLGLFEFSLPRQQRMISSGPHASNGPTDRLVTFLRDVSRSLRADRGKTLSCQVSRALHQQLSTTSYDWKLALTQEFGGRFRVSEDDALDGTSYVIG